MKSISRYYKLTLFDVLVVLITAFCSIIVLSNSLAAYGTSKYVIFQCLAPIFPGLLFLILDVAYIIINVDMKEMYFEKNLMVRKAGITKMTKMQKTVTNLLYFTSVDVIILVIVVILGVIFGRFSTSIIEVIISHFSLFVLALYHIIVLNMKS